MRESHFKNVASPLPGILLSHLFPVSFKKFVRTVYLKNTFGQLKRQLPASLVFLSVFVIY